MERTEARQRPGTDKRSQQGEARGKEQQQGQKPHAIEWTVAGLSGVLVLAMIGFILYQAISAATKTPELSVAVERIEAAGDGFRVAFRAINAGDTTAAGVTIEGQLQSGDETIETSEVTLDYVPAHSERKGGLLFNHDPSRYQLQLEAKGYKEP